jgi:hypothetical protein
MYSRLPPVLYYYSTRRPEQLSLFSQNLSSRIKLFTLASQRNHIMTFIFADNTGIPIVPTKRIIEAIPQKTDSLGNLTFPSTSLPKSSGLSQFIVSTSRPRNAIIDDNKEEKKGEEGASLKRELLKDNMYMLNQALALLDTDDDSDSESESEDDYSLF